MIKGLGNDIIEVARMARAIQRHGQRFLDKHFTQSEQQYCKRYSESARHFAGRFAAKEAILKALGTGLQPGINWLDIDIYNDTYGKPCVELAPHLHEMCGADVQIWLSISHCHHYATAVAILAA